MREVIVGWAASGGGGEEKEPKSTDYRRERGGQPSSGKRTSLSLKQAGGLSLR